MAKKKSKSNLGKVLGIIAAILGVVAIGMIFVDTIKIPDTKFIEGEGYNGLKVVFGYKEGNVSVFSFSIMALVTYLLMIVGVALSILSFRAKKGNKVLDLVTAALFVVAGVLCFLMPSLVAFSDTIAGMIAAEIDYTLAIGAIVSAITSILAAVAMAIKALSAK